MSREVPKIQLPLPRGCMGIQPKLVHSRCAMGVDNRYNSWDVFVLDVHRPFKHKPDQMPFRTVFSGKVRDEADVLWLAAQYPVVCGGVDSRPEATLAARLVDKLRKMRKDFWRVQYNTNPSTIEYTVNEKEHLLTLERTMTMDEVFFAINSGQGMAIPQNYREISGGDFASELCAPTRQEVEWHGQPWPRWTEKEADHTFHAMNYAMFMARYCNLWTPSDVGAVASEGYVSAPGERSPAEAARPRRDPFSEDDDGEDQDWQEFHGISERLGF